MGLGSMGLGRTVGNTHVGAGMVLVQPLTHGFGCRSTHGCTHARLYRRMAYLIKWKDQPTEENSWEPESHLTHAQHLLHKYKKRHGIDTTPSAKSSNPATTTCPTKPARPPASRMSTPQNNLSTPSKTISPSLSSQPSRLTIRLPPRPSRFRGMDQSPNPSPGTLSLIDTLLSSFGGTSPTKSPDSKNSPTAL